MITIPPDAGLLIVSLALLLLLLIALAPLYREDGHTDSARVRACAYDLANNPHAHCWCGQH